MLGDAVREILADARQETQPCRSEAFRDKVRVKELHFETPADYADWRPAARRVARKALADGDFLLWLSGNHLGVLPVYDELPAEAVVLQLDAHLDIYNLDGCATELSHGNYLMFRAAGGPAVVQVGHRDLFLPAAHAAGHYSAVYDADAVAADPGRVVREAIKRTRGRPLWIDLDCDAFDPAFFPATHQPLPFGLTPAFVLGLIRAAWSDRVLGVSISEYDPGRDREDRSLGTLVWLVERLLLLRYEGDGGTAPPL